METGALLIEMERRSAEDQAVGGHRAEQKRQVQKREEVEAQGGSARRPGGEPRRDGGEGGAERERRDQVDGAEEAGQGRGEREGGEHGGVGDYLAPGSSLPADHGEHRDAGTRIVVLDQ